MSSPIHKFLFSDPPSPPHLPLEKRGRPLALTSVKALIDQTEYRFDNHNVNELKIRSPKTPQQSHFTFNDVYPVRKGEDTESTPRAAVVIVKPEPVTPRSRPEKAITSPSYLPTNVPSSPLPIPSTLPRPLLRLILLLSLLVSSMMILVFVPVARLPSLRAANAGRRLALAEDRGAFVDIDNAVTGWDKGYRPPQIGKGKMLKRTPVPVEWIAAAPHAKEIRPIPAARPLPPSHELLAIQSYLLASAYNVLPTTIDPAVPLDANSVLAVGAHFLGDVGSPQEKAWFEDLETERGDEIVIWYGGNGNTKPPHELLSLLKAVHGPDHEPTLIPCHGRSDLSLLNGILDRLAIPLEHYPLVMIANEPFIGDPEGFEELRGSGKLASMLEKIGWRHEEKDGWKPKLATVRKREVTELERALKA